MSGRAQVFIPSQREMVDLIFGQATKDMSIAEVRLGGFVLHKHASILGVRFTADEPLTGEWTSHAITDRDSETASECVCD